MAEASYVLLDDQANHQEAPKKIFVFVTSHHKNFTPERDVIFKEVLTDLRVWCEVRCLQLTECDFQWGNFMSKREQEAILKDIQSCYYNGIKPFFINISSENLGWVPQVGRAPKHVIKQYCKSLHVTSTEQEVLRCAYRDDNENVLYLLRQEPSSNDIDDDEKDCDTTDTAHLVDRSGHDLTHVQEDKIFTYSHVQDGKGSRVLDSKFVEKIATFLRTSIARDLPQSNISTTDMVAAQHAFVECRSQLVIGQEAAVTQIIDYIQNGDKDVPLVILGGPGSGKSSLLCKAVKAVASRLEQNSLYGCGGKSWQMFYHFVGAVPGSTDLETMLKRLLKTLRVVSDSDLPKDVQAACQLCCSALGNQQTPPTIVVIDSLNQFPEDLPATVLSWLPRKLGPQVRCILSMIDNTPPHQTLIGRESRPQELYIKPLDMTTRKALVKETMSKYHRTLRSRQLDRLLSKRSSQLPLWLTVACEQLHALEDFRLVDEKIDSFPDDLLDMLEYVLEEYEHKPCGDLVMGTLCLLEASSAGLLESELLAIIGHDTGLLPPAPFDEKEEKECSEKEKKQDCMPSEKWSRVFRLLRPFLRPYGDSREGRLDFYHRAMSKAVRRRYFYADKEAECELRQTAHGWWHKKLADYFETVTNVDRFVEEYPYQLSEINDTTRLSRCLCNWHLVNKLYHEEFSSLLLKYWRKAGGADQMVSCYMNVLSDLETEGATEEEITRRHEQIARLFLQAGKYSEALDLARTALKMEEQDLGGRDERLAELYGLVSDIYDERLKLHDFVSTSQLPDLERSMRYSRKSIAIRKRMTGEHNKFKLGMALMRMSFNMESWQSLTNDETILQMGLDAIDTAILIFSELNDRGHYAEALMTKGVLAPRGSVEQLKLYNEAMDISQQLYGEHHLLTSRLYINIGITHEDNKNYTKAYQYFKKWAEVSEIVLGSEHPKTKRAKGVLKEARYMQIARNLGEHVDDDGGDNSDQADECDGENGDDVGGDMNQLWIDVGDDDDYHFDDDDDDDDDVNEEDFDVVLHHHDLQLSMQNLLIMDDGEWLQDNQSGDTEPEGSIEDNFNHTQDVEGNFADNQDIEGAAQGADDVEDASRDNLEIEDHLNAEDISIPVVVSLLHHGDGSNHDNRSECESYNDGERTLSGSQRGAERSALQDETVDSNIVSDNERTNENDGHDL